VGKLICFGDSLTFGSIGYSYIKFLKATTSYTIKNKGINGDTTSMMYGRLKRYVEHSNSEKKDIYIICIGTNDLLLPYLTSISPLWRIQMTPRVKAMKCLTDDSAFEKQYRKIFETILLHNQNMIVLGLSHLELLGFPNDKLDKRNGIIKKLAEEYHVSYIDVVAIQSELNINGNSVYSWKNKNLLRLFEGIVFAFIPGIKDYLSKTRHLRFTIDGAHWNSKLAKAISDKIQTIL